MLLRAITALLMFLRVITALLMFLSVITAIQHTLFLWCMASVGYKHSSYPVDLAKGWGLCHVMCKFSLVSDHAKKSSDIWRRPQMFHQKECFNFLGSGYTALSIKWPKNVTLSTEKLHSSLFKVILACLRRSNTAINLLSCSSWSQLCHPSCRWLPQSQAVPHASFSESIQVPRWS